MVSLLIQYGQQQKFVIECYRDHHFVIGFTYFGMTIIMSLACIITTQEQENM